MLLIFKSKNNGGGEVIPAEDRNLLNLVAIYFSDNCFGVAMYKGLNPVLFKEIYLNGIS